MKSGVTIASGVDLGQQDVNELRKRSVPQALINKLKPYLGLTTPTAVARAGLKPENLRLTLKVT